MEINITCESSGLMPIDELNNFQGKLKSIDSENFEKLKQSIIKYGFSFPIFVWNDQILDGHQRFAAVKSLVKDGYSVDGNLLPVDFIKAEDAKEAAEKLLLINSRYATIDQDDFEVFTKEFEVNIKEISELIDIPDIDFDFEDNEPFEGNTDPDDVPEVEETPVTKMGDIWLLGEHRLCCGDSTKIEDVERLMDGHKADLIFTSPPYDNQRTYNLEEEINWPELMSGVFGNLICTDDCQVLVNLGLIHKDNEVYCYWNSFIDFMRDDGWRFFGWYVWDKLNAMVGDFSGRLNLRHEWILHFNKKSLKLNKILPCKRYGDKANGTGYRKTDGKLQGVFSGDGKPINKTKVIESVIQNDPMKARIGIEHPAMFPPGLVEKIIKTFPNNLIYEPFSGSGTTIIAAQQTGRKCYAMEISPQYVDVAVKRWQDFTGEDAVLESIGKTYNQLKSSINSNP